MKYSKIDILAYLLGFLKIIGMFLMFELPNALFGFSIVVIPLCVAMSYHESLAILAFLLLVLSLILWLCAIILSLLGIKFKKLRKISMIFLFIVMLTELVMSSFVSDVTSKISGVVISILFMLVIGKSIYDFWKKEKNA